MIVDGSAGQPAETARIVEEEEAEEEEEEEAEVSAAAFEPDKVRLPAGIGLGGDGTPQYRLVVAASTTSAAAGDRTTPGPTTTPNILRTSHSLLRQKQQQLQRAATTARRADATALLLPKAGRPLSVGRPKLPREAGVVTSKAAPAAAVAKSRPGAATLVLGTHQPAEEGNGGRLADLSSVGTAASEVGLRKVFSPPGRLVVESQRQQTGQQSIQLFADGGQRVKTFILGEPQQRDGDGHVGVPEHVILLGDDGVGKQPLADVEEEDEEEEEDEGDRAAEGTSAAAVVVQASGLEYHHQDGRQQQRQEEEDEPDDDDEEEEEEEEEEEDDVEHQIVVAVEGDNVDIDGVKTDLSSLRIEKVDRGGGGGGAVDVRQVGVTEDGVVQLMVTSSSEIVDPVMATVDTVTVS